jgi:hypothetical protein
MDDTPRRLLDTLPPYFEVDTTTESSLETVRDGLTLKQRKFVVEFVANGGNGRKAAKEAGYSSPDQDGYRLTHLPHVRAAIWSQRERLIKCDLASLGAKVMRELMENEDGDTPAHVRFQAARWSLEAAGHVAAQKALGLPTADKALGEMTIDELAEFVRTGTTALEQLKQAKVVQLDDASSSLSDTSV